MSVKVELHRDVVWFLRHRCRAEERSGFYGQLERVRAQPIAGSEATADRKLSRYMLRFFRFGANIAIFKFDPGKETIWIVECRKLVAKRRKRKVRGPDDDP